MAQFELVVNAPGFPAYVFPLARRAGKKYAGRMDTRFLNAAHEALEGKPPYTPKLIGFGKEGTALVMQGGNLELLRKASTSVVNFETWHERGEPWVIAVAFQVVDAPQDPLEGEVYLNPYDRNDRELIKKLSKQEEFSLFFFSADFCNVVSKRVSLPEGLRRKLWEFREGERTVPDSKPDFDERLRNARSKFQYHYSVRDILDGKPGKESFP